MFVRILALMLVLSFSACNGKKNIEDVEGGKKTEEGPKYDRYWNDLARYLAGKEPMEGSKLDSIDNRPETEAHRAFYQSAPWENYRGYLKTVSEFAEKEFPDIHKSDRVMLYPFSGPDFITAATLFPNAKRYIFWGLEPEGNLPNLDSIPKEELDYNLQSVRYGLRTIITRSFFVTREMGGDFRRAKLNGSLPTILVFLSETGHEVLDVHRIKINMQGEVEPIGKDFDYPMKVNDSLVTGMRYVFRKGPNAPTQELVYIAFDAQDFPGDPHFSKHTELIKWFRDQGTVTSYFKGASYLMHWRSTTPLRNLILEMSDFVFQDDSGIRYQFFDKDIWNITLYGNYVQPVPPFTSQYETALALAYQNRIHPVKPLNFEMGYQQGRGANKTSLIMARKKADAPPPKKDTSDSTKQK